MEQKQEMHDVVEMLLNRMKDYPEDFVSEPDDYRETAQTKWRIALRMVREVARPHEQDAIVIRLEEAKRAVYMGAALKVIMGDDEPVGDGKPLMATSHYGKAPSAVTSHIPIMAAMEARIKAQEYAMQQQNAMRNAYNDSYPLSAQIASNLNATGLFK